jgi:methionyl-tRNA formyltransferase
MSYILFLGYKKKKTKIINFLKKKKFKVIELGNRKITQSIIKKNYTLIVSFGYKNIINKSIISKLNRPIVNLHMSFLPYNRGAHPNFWSFIENTPKGITIHEINNNIDAGPIIIRKKVSFPNLKKQTLKSTYNILFKEIENLFIKKFNLILKKKYKKKYFKNKGTIHYKKDFPKKIDNWKIKINDLKQIL